MELPKKINKFAIDYSNDNWFRAAISGIPIFGSSLDAFISTEGQKITQRRIEKLLQYLQEEILAIKENQINFDYITSEEFLDLFRISLQSAQYTRQEEKIRIYAQILSGTIQNPQETENSENYFHSLIGLTLQDISIAKIIYEQQKEINYSFDSENEPNELQYALAHGWKDLSKKTGLSWEELSIVFHNLQRVGLITEITGGFIDYTGGVFIITHKFKKMMSLISYSET